MLTCRIPKRGLVEVEFSSLEIDVREPANKYDIPYVEIYEEGVSVKINDDEPSTFGENFAGHKYNAAEAFESIVIAYINGNTEVEWIEVPEVIQEFKNKFFIPSGLTIAGREVPEKILSSRGDILTLHLASDGFTSEYKEKHPDYPKEYKGNTAYTNEFGTYALIDEKGNVVTDIEAFYFSGIMQMEEDENIVFSID